MGEGKGRVSSDRGEDKGMRMECGGDGAGDGWEGGEVNICARCEEFLMRGAPKWWVSEMSRKADKARRMRYSGSCCDLGAKNRAGIPLAPRLPVERAAQPVRLHGRP